MSSESSVIEVANICKTYDIYKSPGGRFLGSIGLKKRSSYERFEAISDVSFQVKKGEVVGIVGRNGCGKSTLLQLVAGVLKPSSGSLALNGRVSAILELGAGFNPEATGRENVYINGAILGYSAAAIERKIRSIIEFSDIGIFIDRPVKLYSSGMYVRLAFAIAISVEPDILIVDEALSVGDAAFQRKCFSRIDALRQKGTTILFVSHSETLVIEMCDRAILLEAGKLIFEGEPKFVMGLYNRIMNASEMSLSEALADIELDVAADATDKKNTGLIHHEKEAPLDISYLDSNLSSKSALPYESKGARITSPKILNRAGERVNVLVRDQAYVYTYEVNFDQTLQGVRFSFLIKTISGLEIGGITSQNTSGEVDRFEAGVSVRVSFRFNCLLKSNQYFLNAGVLAKIGDEDVFAHRILDLDTFRVQPVEDDTATAVVDFRSEDYFELDYIS